MAARSTKWGNWVMPTLVLFSVVLVIYLMASSTRSPENALKTSNFEENKFLNGVQERASSSKLDFRILCEEDNARIQEVLNFDTKEATIDSITTILAKTVVNPVQMGCKTLKRLGRGVWLGKCNDGHKYVCLDDIEPSDCLVYSFGLANQISFEKSIAFMGCKVYGYDRAQTTVMKQNRNPKLVLQTAFIGVGGMNLSEILRQNGHENEPISYLKADIEGSELNALPVWIKSGALSHIKQLAFEFHFVDANVAKFWAIIQDLYQIGFRVISYDPNFCKGDSEKGFYQLFEIVFRKTDVCLE
ncbi:hypothetical protein TCAL_07071 [Tigriopus californicus]|uniref:Methyltransferase domain-containing protein n=1 Tax=Tigriopus californicus TaxID=6832 RepID=A0A553PNW9_TIGCA|nr:uncharacterized protein LOC131882603 [Tigriopus californicus]TRY79360.1 hypothetical protein TCAL_07071 [Tigriopus californicus]